MLYGLYDNRLCRIRSVLAYLALYGLRMSHIELVSFFEFRGFNRKWLLPSADYLQFGARYGLTNGRTCSGSNLFDVLMHFCRQNASEPSMQRVNPYKPSVPFVGHRQIVQNQIRCRKTRRLIRFSTVCKQKFLLNFE